MGEPCGQETDTAAAGIRAQHTAPMPAATDVNPAPEPRGPCQPSLRSTAACPATHHSSMTLDQRLDRQEQKLGMLMDGIRLIAAHVGCHLPPDLQAAAAVCSDAVPPAEQLAEPQGPALAAEVRQTRADHQRESCLTPLSAHLLTPLQSCKLQHDCIHC